MKFIKGYNQVEYQAIQKQLAEAYKVSGKTLIEIASAADLTTTNTVYNAINSEDSQSVSDRVLTKIMDYLSVPAFVIWVNGEKHYFTKSNKRTGSY